VPSVTLHSIVTPAEQIRQKDGLVTSLVQRVDMLKDQLRAAEEGVASKVAQAEMAAAQAAHEQIERLRCDIMAARIAMDGVKEAAVQREAQLQVRRLMDTFHPDPCIL
jgi:hypothetical protein